MTVGPGFPGPTHQLDATTIRQPSSRLRRTVVSTMPVPMSTRATTDAICGGSAGPVKGSGAGSGLTTFSPRTATTTVFTLLDRVGGVWFDVTTAVLKMVSAGRPPFASAGGVSIVALKVRSTSLGSGI